MAGHEGHRERMRMRAERMATDGIAGVERFASLERDIGHLVERTDPTHIEPLGKLFAGELLQSDAQRDFLQFSQCFTEKSLHLYSLFSIVTSTCG